jgi:hypothetical protein
MSPSFVKGGSVSTPFGRNEYMRSTRNTQFESYTLAAATLPAQTIDGNPNQKILQPGTALAKITSGADAGKVGPFQRGSGAAGAAAVNEVQTLTRTSTGGTITLTFGGDTTATIPATAAGFTAAAVQAALESLNSINPGDVTVAGGAGGPLTVTFSGQYAGTDVALIVVDNTLATGGTITNAETTAGSPAGVLVGAATDGRGDPANLVGINDTFLPWQLIERDVEVSVLYHGTPVQAWCFELDASGNLVALTNTTADALRGTKGLDLLFK